jgi:hypothetical protein
LLRCCFIAYAFPKQTSVTLEKNLAITHDLRLDDEAFGMSGGDAHANETRQAMLIACMEICSFSRSIGFTSAGAGAAMMTPSTS